MLQAKWWFQQYFTDMFHLFFQEKCKKSGKERRTFLNKAHPKKKQTYGVSPGNITTPTLQQQNHRLSDLCCPFSPSQSSMGIS